ncbi:MAG: tRNA 5-methoxyuridine(34)/uridine 5-oxyacetic acid(34) synthase CmoB [Proteobacteria bacterium]|nr:MAG: tRNA 5-methoxyuridine(34)/uridine 5-oxyacetic acid(34) synthase CmoB [Pseudomonadota bacterium]
MASTPLAAWAAGLHALLGESLTPARHGDMTAWLAALGALPLVEASSVDLTAAAVRAGIPGDCDDNTREKLERALRRMSPWRKGPFDLFGVRIDTEWRSDLKWDRVDGAIAPLDGRRVLDVGCGSGYHCWRMAGAGASTAIGIEPMPLYVIQFLATRRYLGDHGVWVLPLRLEDIPADSHAFDTVFSMGVLYHRRSPLDHLRNLKGALRGGGQLVPETVVGEGEDTTLLGARDRYGGMGNVWFIPSVPRLRRWRARLGFQDIATVDVSVTTPSEQRTTSWMPHESLARALDPADFRLTVEGYAAPRRAVLTAVRR